MLLAREEEMIVQRTAGIFGYYALQLGDPHRDLLAASPISCRMQVGRAGNCKVKARAGNLPFDTASIDLVIISHLLEYVAYPQHVVREAHRVLRPEGHLIVLVFSPTSMYGIRRMLDLSGEYPWNGTFITPMRVHDWFEVLGFASAGGSYAGYALPSWHPKLRFVLEQAGQRWWAVFGASALLHAIKRQPAVRLIRPKWEKAQKHRKRALPVIEQGAGGK